MHPHAGPAALGGGRGRAVCPLLETQFPLMVALGSTLFCAPPHTGGTSTIKNCLIRSAPWAAVVVISGVGEFTDEWSKVIHTKTTFEECDADWWAALSKKHNGEPIACVVDDMDYSGLGVLAKKHAFQLTQFVCTHMNSRPLIDVTFMEWQWQCRCKV